MVQTIQPTEKSMEIEVTMKILIAPKFGEFNADVFCRLMDNAWYDYFNKIDNMDVSLLYGTHISKIKL